LFFNKTVAIRQRIHLEIAGWCRELTEDTTDSRFFTRANSGRKVRSTWELLTAEQARTSGGFLTQRRPKASRMERLWQPEGVAGFAFGNFPTSRSKSLRASGGNSEYNELHRHHRLLSTSGVTFLRRAWLS
jgi:hypothetical protein